LAAQTRRQLASLNCPRGLFDFSLENDVKMDTISINDVNQSMTQRDHLGASRVKGEEPCGLQSIRYWAAAAARLSWHKKSDDGSIYYFSFIIFTQRPERMNAGTLELSDSTVPCQPTYQRRGWSKEAHDP
jgi:hypothetical protein